MSVLVKGFEVITLEEIGQKVNYQYKSEDQPAATLKMVRNGDGTLTLEHTTVPTEYRGQGVGKLLLMRCVEDARADGTSLIPSCSYAIEQFRRNEDWFDVLHEQASLS